MARKWSSSFTYGHDIHYFFNFFVVLKVIVDPTIRSAMKILVDLKIKISKLRKPERMEMIFAVHIESNFQNTYYQVRIKPALIYYFICFFYFKLSFVNMTME